jgi:transposase
MVAMHIESVPNRKSNPTILIRESYREDGKVKKRTIANITHLPPEVIDGIRVLLRGGLAVESLEALEQSDIVRTRPHGHVAAVLGTLRRLGLPNIIYSRPCRQRDLAVAMIVARIIEPSSKLATARQLDEHTLANTLGELLGLRSADEDDLYDAMDWLLKRQERIEAKLAKRHLSEGCLVLYDVTSTYFEGRKCPLAKLGHSRDGKRGKPQIVFGLLCSADGCPIAVEVFQGDTSDAATFAAQVKKVRERFGIQRIVWVGDRGMITDARIRDDLRDVEGLDWITALRAPQVRALVQTGSLQLSLFDQQDLAEIRDENYPGERLIACKNPFLAEERARKREDLLLATEAKLDKVVEATHRQRRALKGKDKIGLRVGKVIGRFKMAKHFRITISDDSFDYERDAKGIAAEAALDGIYIVRTSVPAEALDAEGAVEAYKSLSQVERAFRSYKTVDLKVRPIHHRLADRVRAHIFLCMLAYYVEWHMREALAPMLFDDEDPQAGKALRSSVVAPAQRSPAAQRKARTKRTADDMPAHSFKTLLQDLATIASNRIQFRAEAPTFNKLTLPTPIQQRALDLLGVHL